MISGVKMLRYSATAMDNKMNSGVCLFVSSMRDLAITHEAKRNNRFVSSAPGDEKKVHPGGRKNIFFE